jgi:hypothetical protein
MAYRWLQTNDIIRQIKFYPFDSIQLGMIYGAAQNLYFNRLQYEEEYEEKRKRRARKAKRKTTGGGAAKSPVRATAKKKRR